MTANEMIKLLKKPVMKLLREQSTIKQFIKKPVK